MSRRILDEERLEWTPPSRRGNSYPVRKGASRVAGGLSVLAAVLFGSFAACSSSSSHGAGVADAGAADAADEGQEDATADATGGQPDDVAIYPEAISLKAPDGCWLQGAYCTDNSTCCTQLCVEGGCEFPVRQQ